MRSNQDRGLTPSDFGVSLQNVPSDCPYCHKLISPIFQYVHKRAGAKNFEINVIFSCPSQDCLRAFVASYVPPNAGYTTYNFVGYMSPSYGPFKVPKRLEQFQRFQEIYIQAEESNAIGLHQISGPGYRKALEVLVKDFCIAKHPLDSEAIIKSPLGAVIENFVENESLKAASKRAT